MPRKQRFKPSRKPKAVDAPPGEASRSPGESRSSEPAQPPDREEDLASREHGGESG